MLHLYYCFKWKSLRDELKLSIRKKKINLLTHLLTSLKGHLSASLEPSLIFEKRNGNPETTFIRVNFFRIFLLETFPEGL